MVPLSYTDRPFGSLPPSNAGHVPNIYRQAASRKPQATSHFVIVSHRAPLHLTPTTKRNSMHAYLSRYAGRELQFALQDDIDSSVNLSICTVLALC
jgi:hypothetical protein